MWFKSECDKISECLWDYSAQRLSTAETAQIERHLQQCARCQAEAEAYHNTVGMLGMARQMPVPASQTTWRDLRPSLAPNRRPALRSADLLPRLTLAGAGAALGATLLVVFFSGAHPTTQSVRPTVGPSQSLQAASRVPSTPSPVGTEVAQDDTDQSGRDASLSGPSLGAFVNFGASVLQAPNAVAEAKSAPTPKLPTLHHRNYAHGARFAAAGGPAKPVATSTDADAQLDGGNVSPRTPQNYVLNPVSSSSDDETVRHYVISSIPASQNGSVASNDGEGRAW